MRRELERLNMTKKIFKNDSKSTLCQRYFGFTLAEVLITLGIIGLVASITIPTMMSNYQKQQYVIQLKKTYSSFSNALVSLANDYGCTGDLKCTGLFDGAAHLDVGTTVAFGDAIVKYFNVVKNCKTTETGCMSNKVNPKYNGSSATTVSYDTNYRFITADGVAFQIIATSGSNCNKDNYTYGPTQSCGYIFVDVNGPQKGPNFLGRDIHNFYISNRKGPELAPAGLNGLWKTYCNLGYNGGTTITNEPNCTARIMEESWQMNY